MAVVIIFKHIVSLIAEKELNELLKEVFDGYESDTSETLATADAIVEAGNGNVVEAGDGNVELPAADDVDDTPTSRTSRDVTPRKLRSADRRKDDDGGDGDDNAETPHSSHLDAENDAFHYPGHIPPLKYIFV